MNDLVDDVCDTIIGLCITPEEITLFEMMGAMAVYAHREAMQPTIGEIQHDHAEYNEWASDKIDAMDDQIKQLQANIKRLEKTNEAD